MRYFLFILLFNVTLFGQTNFFFLDGILRDIDTKEVLVGANIIIEGTATGVATDIEGKFNLSTLSDTTIIKISYVGYTSIIDTVIFNNISPLHLEYALKAENYITDDFGIWLSKDSAIRDVASNHYYIYESFDDSLKSSTNQLAAEYGFEFKWFGERGYVLSVKDYNDYVIKELEKRNGINWYESFKNKLNQLLNKQ